MTDFDLAIIGGYWNRSRTRLNKFLLAVYDGQRFHACTHVWSGMTQQQFVGLNEQLRPHWNVIDRTARRRLATDTTATTDECVRNGIVLGDAMPDVWIDPRRAGGVMLQVKAAELVPSRSFATRFSMRFPRVQAVRRDKPWHDCCTLREFEDLCETVSRIIRVIVAVCLFRNQRKITSIHMKITFYYFRV